MEWRRELGGGEETIKHELEKTLKDRVLLFLAGGGEEEHTVFSLNFFFHFPVPATFFVTQLELPNLFKVCFQVPRNHLMGGKILVLTLNAPQPQP